MALGKLLEIMGIQRGKSRLSMSLDGDMPSPETLMQYKRWSPRVYRRVVNGVAELHVKQRMGVQAYGRSQRRNPNRGSGGAWHERTEPPKGAKAVAVFSVFLLVMFFASLWYLRHQGLIVPLGYNYGE